MRSVPICECARVRACTRESSQIGTFTLTYIYIYIYIYIHIHTCVVVFCPDSIQEHVDHTGKKKGHGSVYLHVHVRFCACAYVCVYVSARMGAYIPSHTVTSHEHIKKDTTHL